MYCLWFFRNDFVHEFAGILATLPVDCVSVPMETFSDVPDHMERLLNKRLMAVVEDNLKIFSQKAAKPKS